MALIAFAAPILPGKKDAYDEWVAELNGSRRDEYEQHLRRVGKKREWSLLQQTPDGDLAVVVQEADDPQAMMRRFVESREPFDVWMKDKIQEVHGLDMSSPPPPPELKVEGSA